MVAGPTVRTARATVTVDLGAITAQLPAPPGCRPAVRAMGRCQGGRVRARRRSRSAVRHCLRGATRLCAATWEEARALRRELTRGARTGHEPAGAGRGGRGRGRRRLPCPRWRASRGSALSGPLAARGARQGRHRHGPVGSHPPDAPCGSATRCSTPTASSGWAA